MTLRKTALYVGVLLFLLFLSSCRKDFETIPSSGQLTFSKDTVYLDTVFTNIGSSTFNLKVFNRSDDDISIPSISLKEGANSKIRLNVDGVAGTNFQDITVLAKDSIFVFVETTIDIEEVATGNTEFLYTDAIQFDQGANQQEVTLVSLVKDAIFLFPERFDDGTTESLTLGEGTPSETEIEGFILDDSELTFTNEKPYVIYGYAAVGAGKILTIEAGSRIHFHRDSGIIVGNNGSLQVNGMLSTDQELLENEVIFEGDRLETSFSSTAGQWGAIWLTDGSTNNQINYATIKNGAIGLLVDNNDGEGNPTLVINNSQLYNHASFSLLARTATIEAENTVFGSAGQSSAFLNIGGNYSFKHCTFANYFEGTRSFPTVLLNNFVELQDGNFFTRDLVQANFANCIIEGDNNLELFLQQNEAATLNYNFSNCILQFNDVNNQFADNPLYDFGDTSLFENLLRNVNPDFLDPNTNQFQIGLSSEGIGQGSLTTASEVPLDILGVDRTSSPDIGAYQAVMFEEEN
ncbi:hypothetical protein GWK10_09890 [Spongiivirga citrea]|uniref:Right-handed parallel beta-helix repeat-containing protein n=1 Tax=Spongiivirga citrea TaxID=1481457 RepID=A0A6M0CI36_9FLAO|nr:hypothetical protein [Spongiivirga citrea]